MTVWNEKAETGPVMRHDHGVIQAGSNGNYALRLDSLVIINDTSPRCHCSIGKLRS